MDTQHPDGLEKIRELEAQGHPARLEVEEPPLTPPRFVSELRVHIITKNYDNNKKNDNTKRYQMSDYFFLGHY